MKNDLMFNYLHGTDIWLYQRKDMFRVNTDTSLLGHFMKVNAQDVVLDIGTNNGALLLYASRFTKGKLIGVDVIAEACELAKYNLDYNKIEDYEIINLPVQEVNIDPVDVIVTNPPYFPLTENVNTNPFLQIARHEITLSLEELMQNITRLLKDEGHCFMVHRASREQDILDSIARNGMFVKRLQRVYDENREDAVSLLVEIVKHEVDVEIMVPICLKR